MLNVHQLKHRLYKRDTYNALYGEVSGRMVTVDPEAAIEYLRIMPDAAPAPCDLVVRKHIAYLIPTGKLPTSFPAEVLSKVMDRRAQPYMRPARRPTKSPYPVWPANRADAMQGQRGAVPLVS